MFPTKRTRKENCKYSDFVQFPPKKKKKSNNAKETANSEIPNIDLQDIMDRFPSDENGEESPMPEDIKLETANLIEASHYLLESLPILLHKCPHHDLLVTTSDKAVLPCHALMLATASPVLAALLAGQVREEDGMVRLIMESMTKYQVTCLLEFIYTGQTSVNEDQDMLVRLNDLQIQFTMEYCDKDNKNMDEFVEIHDKTDNDECVENASFETRNGDFCTESNIVQVIHKMEREEIGVGIVDVHHDERVKKTCDYCNFECNTFVLLRRHVRDNHGVFYDNFLDSYDLLKPFKCKYCPEKIKTFFILKSHVKSNHAEQWEKFSSLHRKFECTKCNQKFFSKADVRSHERKVHNYYKTKKLPNGKHESRRPISVNIDDGLPVRQKRKCEICFKIFPNAEKFTDHMKVHLHGDNPFICDLCDFKCSTRKSLKRHIELHTTSETRLLCNECGRMFNCQYDLRKHRKESHNHRLVKIGLKNLQSKQNPRIKGEFICDQCGQSFEDQLKYKHHLKFSHVSEDEKYPCAHCPHRSLTQHSQKLHEALHFPPTLPCEQCGKLFHTKLYLNRHIKQNHAEDNEKPFQCNQCGKGFMTRDSHEGHLNMHAGVKPVQCRYCDMRYQNRSNAIAHEKKVHKELYTRKAKTLGGVRVKHRMAGKEIIGLNKMANNMSTEISNQDLPRETDQDVLYNV